METNMKMYVLREHWGEAKVQVRCTKAITTRPRNNIFWRLCLHMSLC